MQKKVLIPVLIIGVFILLVIGVYMGREYFSVATPDIDCGSLVDCKTCANLQGCGWCASNATCMNSNRFGVADGKKCGQNKLVIASQVCPKAPPAPAVTVAPPIDVVQETVNMIKEVETEGFETRKTALNPVAEPFAESELLSSTMPSADPPVNYSNLEGTHKPVEVNTEDILVKQLQRNGLPSIEGFSSSGDVNSIIHKSIESKGIVNAIPSMV
jgi:hypothetical protein